MSFLNTFVPGSTAALVAAFGLCTIGMAALGFAFYRFGRIAFCRSELQRVSNSLYLAESMGGVGSWVLNVKNQSIQWSDHVFVIHDRDPSLGEPTLEASIEYYHVADRNRVETLVERAIARGQNFEFKARLVAEDGSIKAVISRGICQTNDTGRVERVYGVFIEQSHVIDIDRFDNDNIKFAA
ncbi:MAG: PAS domain-containing protein [Pontixanthobacter sp.]